jgi:hypothetical protein
MDNQARLWLTDADGRLMDHILRADNNIDALAHELVITVDGIGHRTDASRCTTVEFTLKAVNSRLINLV